MGLGKFTSLKWHFQVSFHMIWLVLIEEEVKENKERMGGKKERVHISGHFWVSARGGHMVIIMMIYKSEVVT